MEEMNIEEVANVKNEGEEEEDHVVCEICLSGTVYEGNEILFCDKCNLAVHQGCYGVGDVPPGSWFCYPCEAGLDPATTVCEVCPFTGGAYKPVYKTGKWAHSLCCQWIPEIYVTVDPKTGGNPCLNLSNIDKKRFKLRCNLCSNHKGACVQCCFGRCVTAAHPWCLLKNPQGCTKRVVLDPEGHTIWETFCKTHAASVTEPLKPKPKAKMSVPLFLEDSSIPMSSAKKESKSRGDRYSEVGFNTVSTVRGRAVSMAHAKNFQASRLLDLKENNPSSLSAATAASEGKEGTAAGGRRRIRDDSEDEDSDEDDSGSNTVRTSGKGLFKHPTNSSTTTASTASSSNKAATGTRRFPILNMLEWPGISEGEAMDLDHFWNLISGFHPEDHPTEWLESMLDGVKLPIVSAAVQSVHANAIASAVEAEMVAAQANRSSRGRKQVEDADPTVRLSTAASLNDSLTVIPPLGTARSMNKGELIDAAEELLAGFGGERERSAVLDEDKRAAVLHSLSERLKVLQGHTPTATTAAMVAEESKGWSESKSNHSSTADFTKLEDCGIDQKHTSTATTTIATTSSCTTDQLFLSENEFYTKPNSLTNVGASMEDIEYTDDNNCGTIRVVFDGQNRYACNFKVYLPDPELSESSNPPTILNKNEKWHNVNVNQIDECMNSGKWAQENLIPPGEATEDSYLSALSLREEKYSSLYVRLDAATTEVVPESSTVHLSDRVIIPRDEDNSLCRAIRSDTKAYTILCEALQHRLSILQQKQNLYALSNTLLTSKSEWDRIDHLYLRQQVWKQVCTALNRGIRDQEADFNKSETETLPASWQIAVQGRPKAETVNEEDETEPHEDAICMCCFDGTSVEGNRILFCDGCNATLHQICYGVPNIPDGDFFCDRCQYIQLLASDAPGDFDYYHAKTAVMCCLCPLQHGGLKPTTDGRWVHLCCALWSPETVITDMTEMSPIDISKVPVQLPDSETQSTLNSWSKANKSTADDTATQLYLEKCTLTNITDVCMFCRLRGGLVQQCCAESGCSKVFHPICAWFEGLYMSSNIEDLTFQGVQRSGQYPSGLTFQFYCDIHSSGSQTIRATEKEDKIREDQRLLRCKYRINEDDLEQIPGQNKRKRKKPKRKPAQTMSLGRGAGSADMKELNVDLYDAKCCAACMMPIDEDVFMCGLVSGPDGRPLWEIEEELANDNSAAHITPVSNTTEGVQAITQQITVPSTTEGVQDITQQITVPSTTEGVQAITQQIAVPSTTEGVKAITEHITVPTTIEGVQVQDSTTQQTTVSSTTEGVQTQAAASCEQLTPAPAPHSSPAASENNLVVSAAQPVDYTGALSRSVSAPAALASADNNPDTMLNTTAMDVAADASSNTATPPVLSSSSCAAMAAELGYIAEQSVVATPVSTDSAIPALANSAQKMSEESSQSNDIALVQSISAPIALPATAVSVPFPSTVTTVSVPANAYCCTGCGIVVHKHCVRNTPTNSTTAAAWQCDVCLSQQYTATDRADIRCVLCPRRGGYLKRTTDYKWAHLYCAKNCPGQIRIAEDGKVDIRTLPKENRKEKCCICNRKTGTCVQCNCIGCTTQFHPLCAARSGKGCIRIRHGEKQVYCYAHLPEGLERLPSGYWVDGYEIERLRYNLERARLIMDVLLRREKHKKMLCKAETELFSMRFHKMLDKIKKRKSAHTNDVDLSDMSLYESDTDDYIDEEEDELEYNNTTAGMYIPFDELKPTGSTNAHIDMVVSTGERVSINEKWIKKNEIKLPKLINITFSGIEMNKKDLIKQTNQRQYMKHFQNMILQYTNQMRKTTQIFMSATEEVEFGKNLIQRLRKVVFMDMKDFIQSMRSAPWVKLDVNKLNQYSSIADTSTTTAAVAGSGRKRTKKGYAVVYEEIMSGEEEEDGELEVTGRRRSRIDSSARSVSMMSEDGVSSVPSESKRARGRPRKQTATLDQWLHNTATTAPATTGTTNIGSTKKTRATTEMMSPAPVASGRKQDDVSDLEDCTPARKKTKKQLREEHEEAAEREYREAISGRGQKASRDAKKLTKKEQQALDAAATAAAAQQEQLKGKRGSKRNHTELLPSASDLPTLVSDTHSKKRQRQHEEEVLNGVATELTLKLVPLRSKDDNKKYTASNLYILERRLKDILNDIEDFEVPDFTETERPEKTKKSKSSKRKNKKDEQPAAGTRRLAEDFESVPYDVFPDYDSQVDRVVTLETMQEKLSAHEYRTLGEFSEDFYVLLNNARTVTPPGSATWADAEQLAELFELYKKNSLTDPSASKPRAPGCEIHVTRLSGSAATAAALSGCGVTGSYQLGKGSRAKWSCACCRHMYSLTNWPTDFDISGVFEPLHDSSSSSDPAPEVSRTAPTSAELKKFAWASELIQSSGSTDFQFPEDYELNTRENLSRRAKKETALRDQWDAAVEEYEVQCKEAPQHWKWICPACIVEQGAALTGTEVNVWWHDDAMAYRGVVDVYDAASHCHRVQYDDNEWEFVNLAIEPCAFGGGSVLNPTTTAGRKKK